MTKEQVYHAQRILKSIEDLQELHEEMMEKYDNINKDSNLEEISDFFAFIIKKGYKGMLFQTLIGIRHKIEDDIKQLEQELKEL